MTEQKYWSLYYCDHATGKDHLVRRGSEAEIRLAMRMAAERGEDVWLLDPNEKAHSPGGRSGSTLDPNKSYRTRGGLAVRGLRRNETANKTTYPWCAEVFELGKWHFKTYSRDGSFLTPGGTHSYDLIEATQRTALEDKLESIRHCIVKGYDEDAQNHIFDLLRGLRCKEIPDGELTRDGLALKELWKPGSTT